MLKTMFCVSYCYRSFSFVLRIFMILYVFTPIFQICVWCWHHIMDMAEKDQSEGRCPACRTPYDKEKIVGMTVDPERLRYTPDMLSFWRFCWFLYIYIPVLRLNSEGNMDRKKTHKSKLKPSEGRKQLANVRVVQRNLVYIVGLPIELADEDVPDLFLSILFYYITLICLLMGVFLFPDPPA